MTTSFYTHAELQQLGFKSCGDNILLSRKASIYGAAQIALSDNIRIDDFCILSGAITIQSYVHIAAYTALYGGQAGITIGEFSTLSSRCAVYALSDDYSGATMVNPMVPDTYKNVTHAPVAIGRHVIVGTNSTILPGVDMGDGAALGAHSLLTESAAPWHLYVGAPAWKLKARDRGALILEQKFHSDKDKIP